MPLLEPTRGLLINWSHPLARGLTGSWLLNEGTGGKVADLGPYREHGNFQGGPPLWRPGPHGCCLQFDGTDECVDCGTAKFGWDVTSELTVAACVNQSANQLNTIFARSKFVRPVRLHAQSNGMIQFRVYTDTVNDCILAGTSYHAIDGSEWVHAVGTWREYDGRLYINGVLEDSDTVTNGNLNFVNDNQSVGIGGTYEAGGYYGCWIGKIEYVLTYNRALSAEEAKWLYREPFAIFERPPRAGLVRIPTATVSLVGSANAQSAASAALQSIGSPAKTEWNWLRAVLFNGMTANAFKLGTALSTGWFWTRVAGCSVLYRGSGMERIDFANVLTVAERNACSISPPSYLPHYSDSRYFYVLHRFNNCGYQEHTLAAAVKVSIDASGELQKPQPNKVLDLRAERVAGNTIRLVWSYCPVEQKSQPARFNVYCDGGTGQIDYEDPVAAITYIGLRFYGFQSNTLDAGRYLFAVRVEDAQGVEDDSLAELSVQLDAANPESIEILHAGGV